MGIDVLDLRHIAIVFRRCRGLLAPSGNVLALATALLAVAAPDSASAKPVVTQVSGVDVDWTRGMLIARAGSAADLRAPSASIARVKAERVARERAVARLRKAAAALPRAEGVAAVKTEALEREVVVLEVGYSSDGTAIVEVGLPIEAVRRAATAPSLAPPTAVSGPTALVVDAGDLAISPAVGYRVDAGAERYVGPVLFFRDRKALGDDARLGKRVRRVSATAVNKGALELSPAAAPMVAQARAAGAPIIVLIK